MIMRVIPNVMLIAWELVSQMEASVMMMSMFVAAEDQWLCEYLALRDLMYRKMRINHQSFQILIIAFNSSTEISNRKQFIKEYNRITQR